MSGRLDGRPRATPAGRMPAAALPTSDRWPGQMESDTPGSVLTEGREALAARVVDRRSHKARRPSICGFAGLETAFKHDDASVASVSVHRLGREPAVYIVPKEP
jgi:hypothetical protein